MSGLTYDAGALIAAERNDRRVWSLHRRALARGVVPVVPAAALTEVWRGDPRLGGFLTGCRVEDLDEARARAAGMLLARCSTKVGAVDASVAEGALRRGDAVVTGNRADVEALATGVRRRLAVIDI